MGFCVTKISSNIQLYIYRNYVVIYGTYCIVIKVMQWNFEIFYIKKKRKIREKFIQEIEEIVLLSDFNSHFLFYPDIWIGCRDTRTRRSLKALRELWMGPRPSDLYFLEMSTTLFQELYLSFVWHWSVIRCERSEIRASDKTVNGN